MKALLCLIAAFGLALAASAQRQPNVRAQGIKPLDVPFPALERGQKPNFIVVVTDDQGWDDIGRNNPRYVHTPNLDRFIQEGTFFDNYYVTPQCAQSRAAMLTGRYPARVGTMLVNGAWDFINSYEVTAAKLLGTQNYATAQFGKWHNSEVQGYEPWSPMVGFKKADIPVSTDGTSNMRLMRTNGTYTAAKGDIERVLLAKMLRYLNKRDEGAKPFYIYYAPHSIHLLYEKINGMRQTHQIRFSPAQYKQKFYSDPHIQNLGITNATIDAWAALEYLDDVLGSLFNYLKETGLDKTTYVMVMSDNGSALMREERGTSGAKRMPSGMKGDKSTIWEGGIRNFLAVQGPGVQAGVVDSTLLHIIDILPTITDLAGLRKGTAGHLPFDGISFKNLLLSGSGDAASSAAAKRRSAVPEAGNALGEDLPMMLSSSTGAFKAPAAGAAPVSALAAAPAAKAPVASTKAAPVPAAASKAPAAAAPVKKAPAAPASSTPAAVKAPVAAAPAAKAPAAPAASTPAAAVKAPAAAAPVVKSPAAAAGDQTASTKAPAAPATKPTADNKAPAAAVPVSSTPTAPATGSNAPVTTAPSEPVTTGSSSSSAAAPAVKPPTPAPTTAPATAKAPVPEPTPAAAGSNEPVTAPAAAPTTQAPVAPAPAAAPATKEPAAPAGQAPAPVTRAPTPAPATAPAADATPKVSTPAPATTAPAAPTPAPATKVPALAATPATPKVPRTSAPATKAPATAAPAAGSTKTSVPAKTNSTKAAVLPTTGKTPVPPSTGKTTGTKVPTPRPGSNTKTPITPPDAKPNTQKPIPKPDSEDEDVTAVNPPPRRVVGRGGSAGRSLGVARGNSQANSQQYNRMLFFMGPHCWDANAVPILGPNREVLRPQPLFNFKTGGMLNVINGRELPADKKKPNPGFEVCMAVRHREFKWVGLTDKVYRVNGTHKEDRANEVEEPQATALRNIMRSAAEKWWQSVIMEPHSLEKPIFYLGLGDGLVTNMLVSGAHERTPAENIRLIPNGAAGFKAPGDRICFKVKVMSPGTYDVSMFYTSTAAATLKLSIGMYASILTGTANSITTTLPAQSRIRGLSAGAMVNLTATGAKPTEACLQLISSSTPGKAVFNNLANIRFTKRQPWQSTQPPARKSNQPVSHHGFGASIDSVPTPAMTISSGNAAAPVAVPAPGLDMTNPNNSWLQDVAAPAAGFGKVTDKWEALRLRNAWPDGQGAVFESMYSPYNTEGITECSMCNPEV